MNPREAIKRGFSEAEKYFLNYALNVNRTDKEHLNLNNIDRSGSCAIVILVVDEIVYVANVGDSRAIMSA